MNSDERGYLTDTLVILIFVYLSGAITGVIGSAYWNRHTSSRKELEEQERPPSPPPVPDPLLRAERVEVIAPPSCVKVGTTARCYAYHDVDNPDNRCDEMTDIVRRYPGAKVTKRFYPCKVCFPEGTFYDQETYFAPDGLPRGVRPRRVRDNVPLVSD